MLDSVRNFSEFDSHDLIWCLCVHIYDLMSTNCFPSIVKFPASRISFSILSNVIPLGLDDYRYRDRMAEISRH